MQSLTERHPVREIGHGPHGMPYIYVFRRSREILQEFSWILRLAFSGVLGVKIRFLFYSLTPWAEVSRRSGRTNTKNKA
jgi:hypothetical protein